ncbi:MAG: nitrogenase cofactor biosynthesis protein NifB [Nitrospinae bacterium]|nr:nitrogenase cofactor biosynthesis protein NifB [Nitrospinota bacterium]
MINTHPCYSEEASHFYARMHVAVAPKCNIQCNYCNRRYDCINESRPGVASRILKPVEAVNKVLSVKNSMPNLTVIGIAGPGDPLANPEETFRTFELIREKTKGLDFCLSTNGLKIIDYIEKIKSLNINHVTITINMIEPEIGERIYRWIKLNGKIYKGLEASRILHERQIEGLRALISYGIMVKVNSVLIPGINDEHLVKVSRFVKSVGAFIHNIMPMVPVEGSYFAKNGIMPPSEIEMKDAQEVCGESMKIMNHCQRCRADAVGMLKEDRESESQRVKVFLL